MKASKLCLQGEFPVDRPKDSSYFFNMCGSLWDNKVVGWVEREMGKKETSQLYPCMSGFIHGIRFLFYNYYYVRAAPVAYEVSRLGVKWLKQLQLPTYTTAHSNAGSLTC